MRNKKITLIAMLIVSVSLWSVTQKIANGSQAEEVDQTDYATSILHEIDMTSNSLSQTFLPTLDRLTKIKILVKGDGIGKVGLKLYRGNTFLKRTELVDEPNRMSTATLHFDDFEVTPGVSYKIRPYTDAGNTAIGWYRTMVDEYDGGAAYKNEVRVDYDFLFETFGYDYVEPVAPDPAPEPAPAAPVEPEPDPATPDAEATEEDESMALELAAIAAVPSTITAPAESSPVEASVSTDNDSNDGNTQTNSEDQNVAALAVSESSAAVDENSEAGQESKSNPADIISSYEIGRKSLLKDVLTIIFIAIPVVAVSGFVIYKIRRNIKKKKEEHGDDSNMLNNNE